MTIIFAPNNTSNNLQSRRRQGDGRDIYGLLITQKWRKSWKFIDKTYLKTQLMLRVFNVSEDM